MAFFFSSTVARARGIFKKTGNLHSDRIKKRVNKTRVIFRINVCIVSEGKRQRGPAYCGKARKMMELRPISNVNICRALLPSIGSGYPGLPPFPLFIV